MSHHHEMTDTDKLAHLLDHWQEHNREHSANYASWADKADAAGQKEVAELLRQAAQTTDEVTELFIKAGQYFK
jgi:rubrerythrin